MPQYWTPATRLTALPSGIGITDLPTYPNFYNDVDAALHTLYQQPVGQSIIDGLIQRRTNHNKYTTIKPPRNGGDANEAQSLGGDDARTQLTQAIGTHDTDSAINAIKIALNASGHHNDYNWMAQQLNNVPRYRIQGAPANGAGNLGVLPIDVERWLKGERPLFNPFTGQELADLKNALQIVIHNLGQHTAGPGGHSVVYWNPGKVISTLTTGVRAYRAAFIGLAHEMIHAYHNAHGTQLSWSEDSTHSSTVLFEYMCVGLGPWNAATPTENGVRGEHHIANRAAY